MNYIKQWKIIMKLKVGNKIRITGYNCGQTCKSKYNCMGIIVGKILEIKSMQPLEGPIVVNLDGCEYSIGRGMFNKLIYEIIEE